MCMKLKKLTKPTIDNIIRDVPAIRELFEEFQKKGFTTEQAYGLTTTILKLVLK